LAILAMLVAVSCYGVGSPYIRKYIEPLNLSTEVSVFGQIGTAAISLLPLYLLGPLFVAPPTVPVIASVIAVGALGSGVAYLLYYRVLAIVGSAIGSSVTYITPIIAVGLGVLLLNEQLHWYEPVGGIIVILGAAISQGRILNLFKRKVLVA
jgi:drug/metabolite transporter (DMT)-like permease